MSAHLGTYRALRMPFNCMNSLMTSSGAVGKAAMGRAMFLNKHVTVSCCTNVVRMMLNTSSG